MYSKKLTKALSILVVALMMVSMFAVTAADGNVLDVKVVQVGTTTTMTVTVTVDMDGEGDVTVLLESPVAVPGNLGGRELWKHQAAPSGKTVTFTFAMPENAASRTDYTYSAAYDQGEVKTGKFSYTKAPVVTPPAPSDPGTGPGTRPPEGSSKPPVIIIPTTEPPIGDIRQIYDDVIGANVDWAIDAFIYLYNRGIMVGDGERHVRPNENVTREEFVKLLVTSFGYDMNVPSAGFEDVYADTWYAPYVNAAYHAGVVLGVSDTEFGTGQNITRQDMCVLIYRAMEKAGKELAVGSISGYTDAGLIADYAQDAIGAMTEAGILSGTDGGRFEPLGFATRAQAARVIYLVIK